MKKDNYSFLLTIVDITEEREGIMGIDFLPTEFVDDYTYGIVLYKAFCDKKEAYDLQQILQTAYLAIRGCRFS